MTPRRTLAVARLLLGVGAVISLGGCAQDGPSTPSPIERRPAEALQTVDGLRQWWVSDAPGALFVKPPRPDLNRYDSYVLDAPKLHFVELSKFPTKNEAIRLSNAMAKNLRRRLENTLGWYEAREPGPTVVRVRTLVSNIEFSGPDASNYTRTTALVSASGLVHFTMEFQDSVSKDPILRFGSRRPLPGGTFSGPSWHELDRARLVFRRFASDVKPNLEALAQR